MAAKKTKKSESGGSRSAPPSSPDHLPARDPETGLVHVLVDTPKGSPIKFKYEPSKGCYTISHILPAATVFPFDFGSIPSTAAEDGDPLDVLLLLDWPTFAGCLVPTRLVGVLEAEQTQEGETFRNDRLIGVAAESRAYRDVRKLGDLPGKLLDELEHFFVSYNEQRDRVFRVLARSGQRRAANLLEAAERTFRSKAKRR